MVITVLMLRANVSMKILDLWDRKTETKPIMPHESTIFSIFLALENSFMINKPSDGSL